MAPLDAETAKKVIRQVEFYFSDSNLPRDNFLQKTLSESEDGNARVVSLSLIISFSRMRGHLGLGELKAEDVPKETIESVAETLRTSTFLKVSEDGTKIGRVTELAKPEEVIKQLDERTIAASPLEYDVTHENVESFFSEHAKVNSVRLPRHVADNRLFCGTALIEFSSEEDAANILKQMLSYSGVELELKTKKDFEADRAKQENEFVKTRPQFGSNRKDKANTEPDYPKGLVVAFKLKSTTDSSKQNGDTDVSEKDGEQNENQEPEVPKDVSEKVGEQNKNQETEVPKEVTEPEVPKDMDINDSAEKAGNGEEKETDMTAEAPEADENEKEEQGASEEKPNIASYKDNKDVVLREDLKSVFKKYGHVKYVDFNMGSDSGYIRFEDAGSAQKARAAAVLTEQGGVIVKNFVAVLEPVTGEAEKEYWSKLRNEQEKYRDNFKNNNRGRGGRHNRGGRNFGGRHSRGRENERPNKIQKVGAA